MATCRECGQPIAWKALPSGKYCPTELDGSDHFDKCSKVRFDRIKRDGTAFETAREAGYRVGTKVKFTRLSSKPIRGKHYVPHTCTHATPCEIPPWDTCACSTLSWP